MYQEEIRQLLLKLALTDDVTYYHSLRVGCYLSEFAATADGKKFIKQAWVTRNECIATGLLHEIGKISWPREVLLSAEQLQEMKEETLTELWAWRIRHPLDSYEMIMENYRKTGNRFWERIAQGVVSHHENYYGGGYPRGSEGQMIPLLGRGIRIFDSFVAMTDKKRYCEPMKTESALKKLAERVGCLYDPFWSGPILTFLKRARPCTDLDHWLEEELLNF